MFSLLSLLTVTRSAQAQTSHCWQVTYATAPPPASPAIWSYNSSTSNQNVSGNWSSSFYSLNGSDKRSNLISGTVVATLTWVPATGQTLQSDPPPSPVSIIEYANATESPSLGSDPNTHGPAGSASDGLGDNPVVSGNGYISSGFHVVSQTPNAAGVITISDPLSAINPPYSMTTGYPPYTRWPNGANYVNFTVYPINIGLEGVTVDTNDESLHVLTGGQVTAFLNSPANSPFGISNYQWSFSGATGYNPFYTWDPTAPNSTNATQFVPIPSAYLAQSSISFYDAADQDAVVVHCTATLTPPSGSPLTVNFLSKQITYHKPTLSWTVNVSYKGLSTGFFNGLPNGPFGAQELWGPMTITLPLPFNPTPNPGFGAVIQIADLSRSNTRSPLNGKPSIYSKLSVLYGNGSTGSLASPTGLDAAVPYPFGSFRNPDGTFSNSNGMWDALNDGYASDGPQQPYINSDQDGGGNAWYASTASDSFNTWVMYSPTSVDDQGTIYVPIQTLTWSWGGNASLNHLNFWDVDENPPFSPGTPSKTDTYPLWSLTIPLNPIIGP